MAADTDDALYEWSDTESNNKPSGPTTVGTNWDDNLRMMQKVVRGWLAKKGADIASAATTDIGAIEGLFHDITGSVTITSFGTVSAGIWKILKFEGTPTITHNATSLILPGTASIVAAAGDMCMVTSEGGGNWRMNWFTRAALLSDWVLGTEVASTSGTSIDFTSIPSWAKKIVIQFVGVSTSGTSNIMVQLGDAGGVEPTGYLGAATTLSGTSVVATANFTTGIGVTASNAGTSVIHGTVTLTLEDAANFTWVGSTKMAHSDGAAVAFGAGSKSTSAALDRVRITTVGGTDTFDAGAINILYS